MTATHTSKDLKALQQIYEDYVLVYGQEAQSKMVLEESLEFAHAAMKVDRVLRKGVKYKNIIYLPYAPGHPGWRGPEMLHLLDEAIDCLVMIGQLPWITGAPETFLEYLQKGHETIVAKMKAKLEKEAGP